MDAGRRRFAATVAAVIAIGAALPGCTGSSDTVADARLTITPSRAYFDTPTTFTVRGLPAHAQVTVRTATSDAAGVVWRAAATFRASGSGTVDSRSPAVAGSYRGTDPMGLLLLARPAQLDPARPVFVGPRAGYRVRWTVETAGHTVADAGITRTTAYPAGLRMTAVRPAHDGVYGELLLPPAGSPTRPGVVTFGGSEGGISGGLTLASTLAAHGYPVLALAYFGEPGLPSTLQGVPLEYFARALRILRAQPVVDPRHVLVYGVSRGGEAALLVGATYPDLVDGVVAGVPNSRVYDQDSWTLHGAQLPTAPIPVERIRGPILQACGTDDSVWTSCTFTAQIAARLRAHHFGYPVTSLTFHDAGHSSSQFVCCYTHTPDALLTGGTLQGDQEADVTGHADLLAFLARQ